MLREGGGGNALLIPREQGGREIALAGWSGLGGCMVMTRVASLFGMDWGGLCNACVGGKGYNERGGGRKGEEMEMQE